MQKILIVSDSGVPSGYGRIADNLGVRLVRRGWKVMAGSFAYDGLLPPHMNGVPLPYHVAPLGAQEVWGANVAKIAGALNPAIIMVIQDAPYAERLYHQQIDWSQHKFVIITPVDGAPIAGNWVNLMSQADGRMTISQFGVDAYAEQGIPVELCRPAVDLDKFAPIRNANELVALRALIGRSPQDWILGTMCMNQGRKLVPLMLEAFFRFAKGKPNVFYFLDMHRVSVGGWNIEDLCDQQGWDKSKLIFANDFKHIPQINDIANRYKLLSAHMVVSSREGFGLPLVEAQASGVVSMALDYSSGPEICGDGKGILIKTDPFFNYSGWGGAVDRFPDKDDMVQKLNLVYRDPHLKVSIARKGMASARAHTWDHAVDAVEGVLAKAIAQ